MDIIETVYESLKGSTEEVQKAVKSLDTLEKEIDSGRYSPQALRGEIGEKRNELRKKVESATTAAFREAESLIDQYKKDVKESNRLDPADLTDDVKLLQPGIVLKAEDIKGMLERNQDNKTMTQIILRYAEEHGIKTGTYYVGGHAEEQSAENLKGVLSIYKGWIAEPNAMDMLDTFFGVKEKPTW